MQTVKEGFPRRCYLELQTAAERAIGDALFMVEAAGCHPLLTEAVLLLGQAKNKVADFVESPDSKAVVHLRGHLLGLGTGRCLRCGESTARVQSERQLVCQPKSAG